MLRVRFVSCPGTVRWPEMGAIATTCVSTLCQRHHPRPFVARKSQWSHRGFEGSSFADPYFHTQQGPLVGSQ